MFHLALELGMTVGEIQEKMTPAELIGWSRFFEVKHDREKKAHEGQHVAAVSPSTRSCSQIAWHVEESSRSSLLTTQALFFG